MKTEFYTALLAVNSPLFTMASSSAQVSTDIKINITYYKTLSKNKDTMFLLKSRDNLIYSKIWTKFWKLRVLLFSFQSRNESHPHPGGKLLIFLIKKILNFGRKY